VKFATRLVRFEPAPGDPWRPSCTPLYQTATFTQDSAESPGPYDYTRSGNPTRDVLQRRLADLEGARHALAYVSGSAALASVTGLLRSGDGVLAGRSLYGGTMRWLSGVLPRRGLNVVYGDPTDAEAFAALLHRDVRLVLVETPSNPLLEIADVRALRAALDTRAGTLGVEPPLLAVDNTLMTPYLQRPLALGADLVLHSATKGLSGHGDVTAGAVATDDDALARELRFLQNAEGNALAPFEALLLIRGIKTLAVRLDRQQATAGVVAQALCEQPGVVDVRWPGLPHHPGAAVHARQASGPGPVVTVELRTADLARRLAASLRLFPLTVSFGAVGSSACHPSRMSHASVPDALRGLAPAETLVRLSIGLEDPTDLLEDLARSLRASCMAQECSTSSQRPRSSSHSDVG
jgi:cystathionine beta-lyase